MGQNISIRSLVIRSLIFGWEFLEEHYVSFSYIPETGELTLVNLCNINNSENLRNDKVGRHDFPVCCSAAD